MTLSDQSLSEHAPSEQAMRDAVTARDSSWNGRFFYGVITTGVFCLPSCPTRHAKPENLRFFPTIESAMAAGFRPCKRCNPASGIAGIDRLVRVARHIEAHAEDKLPLSNLAKLAELSPSRLQRVFKQTFGISPKAYQDAVRIRLFKKSLKQGQDVTSAIYASGFGSSSRVYGEASRNVGMTPRIYQAGGAGEIIHYACRQTALGLMAMAATDRGVCFVQFDDDEVALVARLTEEFPKADIRKSGSQDSAELDSWIAALDQHISNAAPRPELPLDMRGTAFQMKVWQFLLSIREGEVLSYSQLAAKIDKPKAVRAVASACAKNRIGVLIPCHRILRGDGGLGGYRWGLERKRALLQAEQQVT